MTGSCHVSAAWTYRWICNGNDQSVPFLVGSGVGRTSIRKYGELRRDATLCWVALRPIRGELAPGSLRL